MNWFIYALKNSFNFKDRARRKEYGWFALIVYLISLALDFLQGASADLGQQGISTLFAAILVIFEILMFIPSISVTTRRLHDLGYSGWWQTPLIILSIPFYIWNVEEVFSLFEANGKHFLVVIGMLFILASAIFILWLIFKDGQPHANKYGESPKYPSDNSNPTSANNLGNLDA